MPLVRVAADLKRVRHTSTTLSVEKCKRKHYHARLMPDVKLRNIHGREALGRDQASGGEPSCARN